MERQNNFVLDRIDNNSWSENLQEFSVQVVQSPLDPLQESTDKIRLNELR